MKNICYHIDIDLKQKKLDTYGFVYTEKKGGSNFYHINKNLSWRQGKIARDDLEQNEDMFTRFDQFQTNNTKEMKAIKKLQNRIRKETATLT